MKKVLIIGPNIGMGGVEKASCTLSNSLDKNGFEVNYLALIPENHFFELNKTIQYIEPNGFNLHKMSFIKTLFYIRKNVFLLKPDSIIAYTKFYAALVNLALLCSKHQVIFSERSSPLYVWPAHINLICKLSVLFKRPKLIIAQTKFAANYQKLFYKNTPITVIPNIVNQPIINPNIQREKIILCVGRFNDTCKGFDLMIQAFNLLKNDDWELHFAGGLESEAFNLIKLANPARLNKIKFLGKISKLDLLFAKAGIFVIPSRSEGFPNALVEAMMASAPSISYNFNEVVDEIITNNFDGIIVNPEDTIELAEKIDYLISNEAIRNKLSINAKLSSLKFSEVELIKQYQKLLN